PAPPAPPARPWVKLEPTPFRAVELAPASRPESDPLAVPAPPPEAQVKPIPLPAAAWPVRPLADGPELPGLSASAAPAGRRFFACDGRRLFAVKVADGAAIWETAMSRPSSFTRGLVTTDGKLVVTGDEAVGCFETKTGAERWRFALPEMPVTAAALAGSR